jgi:hypothetical protein
MRNGGASPDRLVGEPHSKPDIGPQYLISFVEIPCLGVGGTLGSADFDTASASSLAPSHLEGLLHGKYLLGQKGRPADGTAD